MVSAAYLCCLGVDNFFRCQITLVANKQLVHVLIGISVNLVEPLLDVVKAFLISDVIHNLRKDFLYSIQKSFEQLTE